MNWDIWEVARDRTTNDRRTVCIWARVRHGQNPRTDESQIRVDLVRKLVTVYTRASSSSPGWISSLDHEPLMSVTKTTALSSQRGPFGALPPRHIATQFSDPTELEDGKTHRDDSVKDDAVVVTPLGELCEVVTCLS